MSAAAPTELPSSPDCKWFDLAEAAAPAAASVTVTPPKSAKALVPPSAPLKAKLAGKPAFKPQVRSFAALADESEDEKPVAESATAGAAAAAAPVAAPAATTEKPRVIKMPTRLTEEEEAALSERSCTLRVANLPRDITIERLEQVFGGCWGFSEVVLPLTRERKPRGFAFIKFGTPDQAEDCLNDFADTLEIKGRRTPGQTHKVLLEYARKNNVEPRA